MSVHFKSTETITPVDPEKISEEKYFKFIKKLLESLLGILS